MALTWTDEEIAALRAAIASGVMEVEYAGPPSRRVKYQSLKEMRELLASMTAASTSAPTYRRVQFSKGFR